MTFGCSFVNHRFVTLGHASKTTLAKLRSSLALSTTRLDPTITVNLGRSIFNPIALRHVGMIITTHHFYTRLYPTSITL